MTTFIGYKHKPVEVTDKATGEVKKYDRVDLSFVTDKQPDFVGLFGFAHKIEFKDLKQVTNCDTIEELEAHLSQGHNGCIVETVQLKSGALQVTEIHWLDSM